MQRKLTPSEFESYAIEAKKIFTENGLPEDLQEKILILDKAAIEKWLEWIHIFETTLSPGKALEATNYYLDKAKQSPTIFKDIGCSDEQYQQVLASGKKLIEIELIKNIFYQYKNLVAALLHKGHEQGFEPADIQNIIKSSQLVAEYYENKEDKTQEEIEGLNAAKEFQEVLEDNPDEEKIFEILQMGDEERKKLAVEIEENEADLETLLEQVQEANTKLSQTLSKFKIFGGNNKTPSQSPEPLDPDAPAPSSLSFGR